jgi:hypothetical protein
VVALRGSTPAEVAEAAQRAEDDAAADAQVTR